MKKSSSEKLVELSTFIVIVYQNNLSNFVKSKELSSTAQRMAINMCKMLPDLTKAISENVYLKNHVRNCIDAINENNAIKEEAESIVLDLSAAQFKKVCNGIENLANNEVSSLDMNNSDMRSVVFIFKLFSDSINEKFLEAKFAKINYKNCNQK
jgi:hypothetical protein